MNQIKIALGISSLFALLVLVGCGKDEPTHKTSAEPSQAITTTAGELTNEQIENIVRRSYQYVALYNVINKGAMDPKNPGKTGWNNCVADTQLKDHNLKIIARPNNDTLYISCTLDLRKDAVILDVPVLSSKYVSVMTFSYDHYLNVPLTTRKGDFQKPEKLLFYSARTEGYSGEPVEGISRIIKATGDFYGAVFRVMPHANESKKFEKIINKNLINLPGKTPRKIQ